MNIIRPRSLPAVQSFRTVRSILSHRDLKLGHEILRIAGEAIVDQCDLQGVAADFVAFSADLIMQSLVVPAAAAWVPRKRRTA